MTASFIGCKISLISKSEIRYEGILYTIDTKESTIALAKVRSFGTEDRVTDKPVAPRNEVYEYIIFRASDIKDLLVDDPPASSPGLTDPAIIQAQSGGGSSAPSTSSFPSPTPSFPAPQPRTTSVSTGFSNQKTTLSNVMASASGPQQQQQVTSQPQRRQQQDLSDRSPPGTRPQAQPRSQQPVHQSEDRSGARGPQSQQQQRPQPQDRRPAPQQTQQRPADQQREQRDNRAPQQQQPYSQSRDQRGQQQQPVTQQFQRRNDGQQQQQQNRNYGRNQGPQQQQSQQQRRPQQQSDWPTGGQRRDGQNRGPTQPRPRMLDVRKLEEYDFEKANAEFEELTKDVADMTVTDAEKNEPAVASTIESETETYNKQKSFFDSISCEAIERKRGNSSRIDRRVERKQNQETFGVSSVYNNRWNQGYGRGFRGGSRGGGGNYRNNSNRGYYNRDNRDNNNH